MYIGIVTDVFDGIIARKLKVSTQKLRLLDTIFDLFFYLSILFFVFSINPAAISGNILLIGGIFSLEALMYLVSLIRFRKLPSPHSILSKFWGLYIVIEFSLLIMGVAGPHFTIALIFGCVAHLDRILIYLFLKQWDHDIPSSYHALLLRQGKEINRKEIFNG
jgi:CDP-diacylglycerol--glycerol-3-phosphate 3-phosphatidyltransferase